MIRHSKPDILLTNFMMLELLMTRQSERDRQVITNAEGLDFIVLDELHTYRGRQGADVAMLVRRLRDRYVPGQSARLYRAWNGDFVGCLGNQGDRVKLLTAIAAEEEGVKPGFRFLGIKPLAVQCHAPVSRAEESGVDVSGTRNKPMQLKSQEGA